MLKYLTKSPIAIFIYIILVIVTPLVNVSSVQYTTVMINDASAGNLESVLTQLPLIFGLYVLHGLLLYWLKLCKEYLVKIGRIGIKRELFRSVFQMSGQDYLEKDSGEYISSFTNDISILEYKYINAILEIIQNCVTVCTYITAALYLNTTLATVIIVGELISILVLLLTRNMTIRDYGKYIGSLNLFTQKLKEYFSAFSTIKNYMATGGIKLKFSEYNRTLEDNKTNGDITVNFANTLGMYINSFLKFVIVGIGIMLMITTGITFGVVYAAYKYSADLVSPVHSLIQQINSIHSAEPVVKKIKEISTKAKEECRNTAEISGEFQGISYENVSLIRNDKEFLSNINFTFLPGKKYLIIGTNGSGKSTMLKLLRRFTDEYDGQIKIFGSDIRGFSSLSLARAVSYINEKSLLLDETVYNNIALFRDIPKEKVEMVASVVGLRIPLNRKLRDSGINVSSGERRRIEFARSLVTHPDVLILDEALSTLDIMTAYELEKFALELPKQTVIFVSHNFSNLLISKYDTILLMDNGRLIDSGTHIELLARNAYYRHIMAIRSGMISAS